MNEFNFEELRTTWQADMGTGRQALSRDDINALLDQESIGITQLFRRGLTLDMALKALALPALGALLVLFHDGTTVHWLNTLVLAVVAFLVFFQWNTLQAIPGPGWMGRPLRSCLAEITGFYKRRYIRTVYVSGLTGPLVFYTGSLYYSYLKYGGVRPMDTEDVVVFAVFFLLAFGISLAAHLWQFRFHMRELETCLHEISDEDLARRQLENQQYRRFQNRLLLRSIAALGVLVLLYLLLR